MSTSEKTIKVTATVLGKAQQFTCTPGQEKELIEAVELLNHRVEQMRGRTTVRNDYNALLMAALHLCHDYNAVKTQSDATNSALKSLCDKLNNDE
ncbi:hypothetical protein PALB_19590 [Pseudoalteromonas luteoviolacea B = ATCC 29581]|nr:hypothetical protein PALB_19590 [Pseudoalteromonas luteoviolacea B = ATCC 29581]